MTDSKLITLLKRLSPEEFRELEKFTASPYHARGRDFNSLFKILKPFYPDFNHDKLNRQNLFKKLYTDEKYSPEISDHKIRLLFSGMYKLCMDFLIQNELNKDTQRKQYYLLNQLRLKKLYKEFEKVYTESALESELLKGSVTDFINKYFFMSEFKNYLIEKDDYANLFEASFSMREYSVISALVSCFKHESERTVTNAYNVVARHTLMKSLLESLDIERLLDLMKKNNDRFYPVFLIYYTAYKMEKFKDNSQHFFQLRNLLKEYNSIFGTMEKFALWVMMETYCLKNKATGDLSFNRELFSVYNEMLELGIYKASPNENFNISRFRNIVLTAFYLCKYEWLENFIDKYSEELHPKHKEDMKNYSLALLLFGKEDFEAALKSIMRVQFEFFLYKIDVKVILMKIYYELKSYEQVYSTADTALHFLRNSNQLSESHKKGIRNFIKYLKVILKLKENNCDSNDIRYIMKEISDEKRLNNSEWLLKKADALIQLRIKN